RRTLRDLVALRIAQGVSDCVACARARHADIAELAATDETNPTFEVNFFARTIHLAVVENIPAKRVNCVALVPTRASAPPFVMLRQDGNVTPLTRDEQA